MLVIRKNKLNSLVVTASQNKTLANPTYLFSFQHIFSKEKVSFIPYNISTNSSRYDEFQFIESSYPDLTKVIPFVTFPGDGQYWYSIYEQISTGNTDPSKTHNKIEEGRAVVLNDSQVSPFETYKSPNENNSNFIYYTDIENQNKVQLTVRMKYLVRNGSDYQNDDYPAIPFYWNDTLYLTDKTAYWVDGSGPNIRLSTYKDITFTVTGGSQTEVFYSDYLELINLGFQPASFQPQSGVTLSNFNVYSDRDALVSAEPALVSYVPTGNTCGRYIVFTQTYLDVYGVLQTQRRPYQELTGPGCNKYYNPTNPELNAHLNQPGLWTGYDFFDSPNDLNNVLNSSNFMNLYGTPYVEYIP